MNQGDSISQRFEFDPSILEQLPAIGDQLSDLANGLGDFASQLFHMLQEGAAAYQSSREQADQLITWMSEHFGVTFNEIQQKITDYFEDRIDYYVEAELQKRAEKLDLSRSELLNEYEALRSAIIDDISVKLRFHAQNFVDGYAALDALLAASTAPEHTQELHVTQFVNRYNEILRRFIKAGEKIKDVTIAEKLRTSETFSIERIFHEQVGGLYRAIIDELISGFGAAQNIARTLVEPMEEEELSDPAAQSLAENFLAIIRGSESASRSAIQHLKKKKSFKAQLLEQIFRIRTLALGAVALLLSLIAFVIKAIPDNWILGISHDAWSNMLLLLAAALILGLLTAMRGWARAIVLTVLIGVVGVGIYLSGPCRFSFDSWNWVCPTTVAEETSQPIGVFDTPAPDFDQKLLCDEVGGYFPTDGSNPSKCVPVFFVTNRGESTLPSNDQTPKQYFGEGVVASPSFGVSSIAVPTFQGRKDEIIAITPALRSALERGGVPPDRIGVMALKGVNYARPEAEQKNKSSIEGLSRVLDFADDVDPAASADAIKKAFITKLNASLDPETKTALLYIHGFNTPFRNSLTTAAHLQQYLGSLSGSEDARRDIGVPIVFSWPTRTADMSAAKEDPFSSEGISAADAYYKSQIIAFRASGDLADLLKILTNETDIKRLNIVAHSMGNRVLLESFTKRNPYELLEQKQGLQIRAIQAAADVGQKEYKELFDSLADGSSSAIQGPTIPITFEIYVSSTDEPLVGSNIAHWARRGAWSEFANVAAAVRNLGNPNPRTRALDSLKDAARQAGMDEQKYLNEDACRVGLRRKKKWNSFAEFSGEPCSPFVYQDDGRHRTIDISGYGKRDGSDGHNYFEDSPMVLADMGCALKGGTESRPPVRALKSAEYGGVLGYWTTKYWKLDPKINGAESCKAQNIVRLVFADLANAPAVELNLDETIYFDLLKSTLDVREYDKVKLLTAKALAADNIKAIQIIGHTDTSGDETLNEDLSKRRAEAVKAAMIAFGIPEEKISIDGRGSRELAVKTADGVREPANRRAVIRIKVETAEKPGGPNKE